MRSVSLQVELSDVVQLTERLANIPSFSGDEGDVAEFLAGRLREWGFDEVILQEVERGRPNVIGILRGDGSGARFMLNSHLDVDPIPAGYDRPLWQCFIEGDKMYGVGIGNMKAALACQCIAALAVKRSGIKLRGDLIVAGVVGELQGGIGTRHLLEHGPVPDFAIVPEPTNLQIRTLHAGVLTLLVTFKGRAVWAGQTHQHKWVNAVEKALTAARALHRMRFRCDPHPELPLLPLVNVGAIRGGLTGQYDMWRPAFVADTATIAVDVRLHPRMQVETVVADIRHCLDQIAAADPDFNYEIELPPAPYREPWRAMALYMPPLEIAKDHPLVNLVATCHRRTTGEEPIVGAHMPGSHAGADSGHLWEAGVPCFNYGPTQHSRFKNEAMLPKLEQATRVLAEVAAEICSRRRDQFSDEWRTGKR